MKFTGRPEVEGEHGRKKRTRMFFFPLQLFSLISVAPRKQSWWTQQDTTRVVTKVIPSTFSFLSPFLFSVCGGLAEKLFSQSRHCSIHYDTYCSSHRLLTLVPEKKEKHLKGNPKLWHCRKAKVLERLQSHEKTFSSPMLARRRRKLNSSLIHPAKWKIH